MKTFQFETDKEYIEIPEGITEIPNHCFRECHNLKKVKLPSTLITIGSYAFARTNIETISIPQSVTTIGFAAFSHCYSLKEIILEGHNQDLEKSLPKNPITKIVYKKARNINLNYSIDLEALKSTKSSNYIVPRKVEMDTISLIQEKNGGSPSSFEKGIDFPAGRGIIVFLEDGKTLKVAAHGELYHEHIIINTAKKLGINIESKNPFPCAKEMAQRFPILVSEGKSFHLFLPEFISISQIDSIVYEVERRKDNAPILCLQIDKQEKFGYRGSDSSIGLTPNFIIKKLLEIKKQQLTLYKQYEEKFILHNSMTNIITKIA